MIMEFPVKYKFLNSLRLKAMPCIPGYILVARTSSLLILSGRRQGSRPSELKAMSAFSPVDEISRLLLQICFWIEMCLGTVIVLRRLHTHWIGVSLAARFAKECRRRGLVAPASIHR